MKQVTKAGNERLTTTATDDEVSFLGAVRWGVNPPGVALEMARSSAVIVKPKNRGLLSSVTLVTGLPDAKTGKPKHDFTLPFAR